MTDSDTKLEEMEELSVRETDTGPPHPDLLLARTVPQPQSGGRRTNPRLVRGGTPGDSRNGVGGCSLLRHHQTHRSYQTGSAPEASVSAADNSSLPRPESPRTRELKAKRKGKRKWQAENKRRKRATESSTEKSSSVNEPPPAKKATRESSPQPSTSNEPE